MELVMVVRPDMLPEASSCMDASKKQTAIRPYTLEFQDANLRIVLVAGTYGDPSSLDPNFDCGSGPPDIMMAFNAGLYAYESWRSALRYLDRNRGVLGIFTDYNEFSGTGCASLGGAASRESLHINPFRQPRCMPVYSMNLPQFSNGFLYLYNQQELE